MASFLAVVTGWLQLLQLYKLYGILNIFQMTSQNLVNSSVVHNGEQY